MYKWCIWTEDDCFSAQNLIFIFLRCAFLHAGFAPCVALHLKPQTISWHHSFQQQPKHNSFHNNYIAVWISLSINLTFFQRVHIVSYSRPPTLHSIVGTLTNLTHLCIIILISRLLWIAIHSILIHMAVGNSVCCQCQITNGMSLGYVQTRLNRGGCWHK